MFGKVGCSTMHRIQREDTAACLHPIITPGHRRGSLRVLSTDNCTEASPAADASRTDCACGLIPRNKALCVRLCCRARRPIGGKSVGAHDDMDDVPSSDVKRCAANMLESWRVFMRRQTLTVCPKDRPLCWYADTIFGSEPGRAQALSGVVLQLGEWLGIEKRCRRDNGCRACLPHAAERPGQTDVQVAMLPGGLPSRCMVFDGLARNASLDASRACISAFQPPELVCIRPSQFPS